MGGTKNIVVSYKIIWGGGCQIFRTGFSILSVKGFWWMGGPEKPVRMDWGWMGGFQEKKAHADIFPVLHWYTGVLLLMELNTT